MFSRSLLVKEEPESTYYKEGVNGMPKKTFYNLSEEKKKKITDAACREFLRVPYEEVSINQIIKQAEISRGSFYQYFDDKDDLFDYIVSAYREKINSWIINMFKRNKGDIFDTATSCFDIFLDACNEYLAAGIINIFGNTIIKEKLWDCICSKDDENGIRNKIFEVVDEDKINLDNKEDILMLLELIRVIIHDSVVSAVIIRSHKIDEEEVKKFYDKIEFLRRKFSKNAN